MKICIIEGCGKKAVGWGYCPKHYWHFKNKGYVPKRTRTDPNEIFVFNDHAEIVLYNKKSNEIARAIIDIDDVERAKELKWCRQGRKGNYYVSNSKGVLLHRFIMDANPEQYVDHENHNTFDCRKKNLRTCTQAENAMNTIRKDSGSGCIGVYFRNSNKKWCASIRANGRSMFLGYFTDINEAVKARQEAEEKYFGEFRYRQEVLNNG